MGGWIWLTLLFICIELLLLLCWAEKPVHVCVCVPVRERQSMRERESMSAHWIMQIRVKCFTRGGLGVRFRRGWKTCLGGHTQRRSLRALAHSKVGRNRLVSEAP